VIGALIVPIVRFAVDVRVPGSERLNLAAFEQMKFCKVVVERVRRIYPGNRLMPLRNVDRTTFLNQSNLYFLLSDEELA